MKLNRFTQIHMPWSLDMMVIEIFCNICLLVRPCHAAIRTARQGWLFVPKCMQPACAFQLTLLKSKLEALRWLL